MKILIVRMYADNLNIKNYNCQEVGLAKALIRKGNCCDIVLYTDKEPYEEDIIFDDGKKKIHIFYLNAKRVCKNCFFEKRLYEITKNYDIIQTAEYDQIGNVKLKKKVGNKLVIYHGPYESNYTKGYNKKCLLSDLYYLFNRKYKDTPCLAKSALAAEFLQKKGFKNVTTVGVGIDTERFKETVETNDKIQNLIKNKKDNNLKYLLYVGKIEDRRNILFLMDVFEKIIQSNENIRLVMVGKGEKKYVNKCFEYAKSKKIFEKIIYYESILQQNLSDLYKNCEVFLLPTKYEIFGMVLLEAMYFEMPIVTTLNGGSSTIINNEENGMICSVNDLNEWKNTINRILYDDIFRTKISKNAKKQIINNNTWDNLTEKFMNEYKKL